MASISRHNNWQKDAYRRCSFPSTTLPTLFRDGRIYERLSVVSGKFDSHPKKSAAIWRFFKQLSTIRRNRKFRDKWNAHEAFTRARLSLHGLERIANDIGDLLGEIIGGAQVFSQESHFTLDVAIHERLPRL